MKHVLPLLLVLAGVTAFGQSPRAVELFGTFGAMRGGGDEGSEGSGGLYGGAATVPFAARWAVDVQALTSRLSDSPSFRLRRVLFSPGLQYRRGNGSALWFVAFGPGLERDRTSGAYHVYDSAGGARTVRFDESRAGLTLHWRTGAVFQPTSRLLVRGEFFWVNRYVLPSIGAAISVGVRLGR
ncbi:MAG: hypothetical protein ACE141_09795 [Bryobacteraceae bacterium]